MRRKYLCYFQLLTSDAVRKWNPETLEGVYNMLRLFVDLAAARLQIDPVPVKLLSVLSQVTLNFFMFLDLSLWPFFFQIGWVISCFYLKEKRIQGC